AGMGRRPPARDRWRGCGAHSGGTTALMRLHHVRQLASHGLSSPRTVAIAAGGAEDRDATGLILSPGWLDLHAHLRDPAFREEQTLTSGAASAALGGVTHVVVMADNMAFTEVPD